jgi:hypothetical protein
MSSAICAFASEAEMVDLEETTDKRRGAKPSKRLLTVTPARKQDRSRWVGTPAKAAAQEIAARQ